MNIVILGAGAMGSLFGGLLSQKNNVFLSDINEDTVRIINEEGLRIKEKNGEIIHCRPRAGICASEAEAADVVIVFTKSMYTIKALELNKAAITPKTYLMTLQNGAGHENKLLKFADKNHVIIGSTQHNSCVIEPGFIFHGGSGITRTGVLSGNNHDIEAIASCFSSCGIETQLSDNIQKQIWSKLFTNTAASSLTAIFQVPLGFIANDRYANSIMKHLVAEAVNVANALGLDFDAMQVEGEVQTVCINAPNGYTSIYADIRDKRKTEVDTISGFVVEEAKKLGIPVPYHEMIINIIHALEDKEK